MKKKQENPLFSLITRYFLAVLASYNGLFIFYYVFTPLTVYPLFIILSLFSSAVLEGNIITFSGFAIEIIPACIAGTAYYLLFVLNIIIPNIETIKRIKMIFFSFGSLLVLNILRILFLVLLAKYSLAYFDVAHKFFWYFLNIILVVVIWFTEVKIFKVKEIPFWTDVNYLYKKIRSS